MVTTATVERFARLYPYEVETSEELQDAVAFLETDVTPETVVQAGYGAGIATMLLAFPAVLLGINPLVAIIGPLCLGVLVIHGVHSMPNLLAAFRRTEALGEVPNLIGRAVLRMEIQPSTESAVRFAADTGRGPLSESLSAHIDRSMGTPRTGLLDFADEWAEHFPALRRSAHLLVTAQDAPEDERQRTLDRALMSILDGTRNQMADFTASIRGPTTALYAFGVMIPLALVAMLPASSFVGVEPSIYWFVVPYNVVLPIFLFSASLWLLVRRPVAFPPPKVGSSHPDVPDDLWMRLGWAPAVGVPTYVLIGLIPQISYLAPIAAVGLGVGVAMIAVFRPIIIVRNYVRDVEEHLVDALFLVGRQVSEGESVEAIIQQAAEQVPEETGEVFEEAAGLQRRLNLRVSEAFMGEYGALNGIPSSRAYGTAELLAIASREGRPAGRAMVSMADHLEELQEVESETKRQLQQVTGTLQQTASYFGPMVAGATVALAGVIADEAAEEGQTASDLLPLDQLGIVVGTFLITLCFILVPLSIALRHGMDRAMIGYGIGRALISAIPIYVMSVFVVGMIA